MDREAEYDILLFAKLIPLKASLPILTSELQSFTRALILRVEDHLYGAKRMPQPVGDDVRDAIVWLGRMFDYERHVHREEAAHRR